LQAGQISGGMTVAFTAKFYNDANKKKQWAAFCARNAIRQEDRS
jgi:hypothetical protein